MLWRKTVALGCALLALTGCGSAGTVDQAGGTDTAEPVVLTMAGIRDAAEAEDFVAQVERLSGGAVRIEATRRWRANDPEAEADLVREVRAGTYTLGVVGARAWHGLGVRSFDALLAPLEIADLTLEQAVLGDAGLTSQMLQGPAALGLEGIGILPGPLRRPAGVERQFLGPADYKGAGIAISAGEVAARSLAALGVTAVRHAFEGSPVNGFDGVELQIAAVRDNRYDGVLRSLTADVSLWPRPLTIVASRHALTPDQRDLLRRAALAAVPDSIEFIRSFEQEAISVLCRRDAIKLVTAGPERVRELRAAFAPVYAWLEEDRQTKDFLVRMRALRDRTPAEQALTCPASTGGTKTAPSATRSPIDGLYEVTWKN
ncbi:hypothetical protein [Nonomuraea sp. NPDC049480]|uniref:hypothetical protein n=1 Tax=Nonomuraea sp. NPDC049480 TaxID=3364353 RepID=UPI0037A7F744